MNPADMYKSLQTEWNTKGQSHANAINAMIAFGDAHGWSIWEGEEPVDNRAHLASEILTLLRKANKEETIDEFRANFPPAHAPFINNIQEQGQSIENLCYISDHKIAFVIGTAYEKRKAYLLTNQTVERLRDSILSIGKSPQNEIFAIAENRSVTTYKGWEGKRIFQFKLPEVESLPITQVVPFNDGLSVLLISAEGIYLLTTSGNTMIHPVPDPDDKDWTPYIDMEHAALSSDNSLIALGDQCSAHRILNRAGKEIAVIGPQSSYPHFALFSKDGQQVILNSCHFYNGTTIGIPTNKIQGLKIEAYAEDERYTLIDDNCRVYAGIATSTYYIFGDAAGNINAFDKTGKKVWHYFLGSSITGITISDDEKTLWVASCSGIIHTLILDIGQRDDHTIGTGNHYEKFRIIFWKNEQHPLVW
jgi:hypothetical protein